jgi:hypothetical protein
LIDRIAARDEGALWRRIDFILSLDCAVPVSGRVGIPTGCPKREAAEHVVAYLR